MLVIGLTGGIGSGKSTVARMFTELGTPVFDADVIAREVVQPGEPALRTLAHKFGNTILNADGSLNRAKLRAIAFADPEKRRQLEGVLHPLIRARLHTLIAQCSAPYCIACIPLLLETRQTDMVQRILVVDVPEKTQIERVMQRDGLSRDAALQILAAQASRKQRLYAAHDVIDNTADVPHLKARVAALHRRYLALAQVTV